MKIDFKNIWSLIKVANKSFRPIRNRKFDFHFAIPFPNAVKLYIQFTI